MKSTESKKYNYINSRVREIQKSVQAKQDRSEETGSPYYGSSECAWEEAEEEWNRMYGTDDEGEDE
jgi:hypothetical protein